MIIIMIHYEGICRTTDRMSQSQKYLFLIFQTSSMYPWVPWNSLCSQASLKLRASSRTARKPDLKLTEIQLLVS